MESSEVRTSKYEILGIKADSQGPRLKQCIFCAETIQADALKCRFCGEFLNTDKARKLRQTTEQESDEDDESQQDNDGILFAGRPSLLGLFGVAIKAGLVLAFALAVAKLPVEDNIAVLIEKLSNSLLNDSQYYAIVAYKKIFALGLVVLITLWFMFKVAKLKMTYYEVNNDRIEYSRGILDRRVDNLDMFRVIDLKLRRSLLDCIVGIGQVRLVTTDKTDPEFTFEKVRNCRRLYDVIKKASLAADQKQGVIHVE